jgi:ATP-dependent exoDNAse (exonuclease V) alpha subunit
VRGVVTRIVWSPGRVPGTDLPDVVFVRFDGYSGQCFRLVISAKAHHATGPLENGWPGIPVCPETHRWETAQGETRSRTQLPLRLAWAVTIHKSQGLTLDMVVIDLEDSDFSLGLSYVAISRVKTLGGLLFQADFGPARLQRPRQTPTMAQLLEDNTRRQGLEMTEYISYGMDMSEYLNVYNN